MKRSISPLLCAIALIGLPLLAGCSDSISPEAAANLEKGRQFMAENQKHTGVHVDKSGFQYEVLRNGSGRQPMIIDSVDIHYRAMHLDHTVFKSTYEDGKPELFILKGALPGLRKALLNMSEGSKWRIWLPPYLAYTNRGIPGSVQPNETLIYEVELIKIH